MTKDYYINDFKKGLSDGIPIGLGYLSVSFAFGIEAVSGGLPVWIALLISMTNLTSAGQVAGLGLIFSGGSFIEMALTQLIINLRYALMSISLSQKLHSSVNVLNRAIIAFGNTDEVFAVAAAKPHKVGKIYMYGLITIPYIGWALGTFLGASAGTLLPETVRSALGIAIYGMFIAIFIPPAKKSKPVAIVVAVSIILSCIFGYVPALSENVSSGFTIIICSVLASVLGAIIAPIDDDAKKKPSESEVQA